MDDQGARLERLLRAARGADATPEMPFGFDTRVAALARATRANGNGEARFIAWIFRRIAVGAVLVAAFASAATYWQMEENDELAEPSWNAYAIVDTEINSELFE